MEAHRTPGSYCLNTDESIKRRGIDYMRKTSLLLCGLLTCSALALGQEPGPRRYYPLNTPLPPPGRAGMWAGQMGKAVPPKFQQVQIQLPGEGQVTWFEGTPDRGVLMPAPAMAGLLVGPVYRVKLSDMVDFPGVELYPTIEMVDRLHPPTGRETQFPVIVPFTFEELDAATSGRLVTKVIYLEQPNRASPFAAERGKAIPAIRVNPNENALEVADVHGRPLAIVRLGGRVPDISRPEPGFYGAGAPIHIVAAPPVTDDSVLVPGRESTLPRNQPRSAARSRPIELPEIDSAATSVPDAGVPESETPAANSPGGDALEESDTPTLEQPDDTATDATPTSEPAVNAADFE